MAYYAPKFMRTPWYTSLSYQINISSKKISSSYSPGGNGNGLLYVAKGNIGNQTGPFTITYKNNGAQLKFFYATASLQNNLQLYEITPSSITGDAANGYTYTFTIPSNAHSLYISETGTYNMYNYVNAKVECIVNSDMPVSWYMPNREINYYNGTSWSKNKYIRKYNGSGWYDS